MSVFRYDLVRTTRRGRAAVLRTAYALALLVALGGAYVKCFPGGLAPDRLLTSTIGTPGESARFAREYVAACQVILFAAAVLLTPAYAAAAFADERQRGTLDGLLVTHLSGAELVVGKFAARWLAVAGLLLTGVPVLALTQLWGGVDWQFLTYSTAVTLLTTLSLGAFGVLFSVRARTVRQAVVTTYVTAAGLAVSTACLPPPFRFASPLSISHDVALSFPLTVTSAWLPRLIGYAIWHVALCLIALVWAGWLVRGHPFSPVERDLLRRAYDLLPPGSSVRVATMPHLLVGAPPPGLPDARPPAKRARILRVPPVGDDPLLWKELHFGGTAAVGELLRVIAYGLIGVGLTIGLTAALVALGHPDIRRSAGQFGNTAARDLALALLTVVMIGTALRAAGAVSRERERRTLDSLRVLPAGPDAVLRAKWLGSVLRTRWLTVAVGVVLATGALAGAVHPAAVVWLAAAAAVHAGFLASLGLFFSVTAASTGRAAVGTLAGLVATWALPPVLAGYWHGFAGTTAAADRPWLAALLEDGLAPPLTWRFLAFAHGDPLRNAAADDQFMGVALGLAVYAAAAWVLWRLAARRFRRNG
jgi:ABC-type transport system involved in multi-copper enzyme maturation permease subunit